MTQCSPCHHTRQKYEVYRVSMFWGAVNFAILFAASLAMMMSLAAWTSRGLFEEPWMIWTRATSGERLGFFSLLLPMIMSAFSFRNIGRFLRQYFIGWHIYFFLNEEEGEIHAHLTDPRLEPYAHQFVRDYKNWGDYLQRYSIFQVPLGLQFRKRVTLGPLKDRWRLYGSWSGRSVRLVSSTGTTTYLFSKEVGEGSVVWSLEYALRFVHAFEHPLQAVYLSKEKKRLAVA